MDENCEENIIFVFKEFIIYYGRIEKFDKTVYIIIYVLSVFRVY